MPPAEVDILLFIPPSSGDSSLTRPLLEGDLDVLSPLNDFDFSVTDDDSSTVPPDPLIPPEPPPAVTPAPPVHIPVPAPTRYLPLPIVPEVPFTIPDLPPTWSRRKLTLTRKFRDSIKIGMPRAYSTYYDAHHDNEYLIKDAMTDLVSFATNIDPDSIYYHQAIREPYCKQFINPMVDELNEHIKRGHWSLVPLSSISPNQKSNF